MKSASRAVCALVCALALVATVVPSTAWADWTAEVGVLVPRACTMTGTFTVGPTGTYTTIALARNAAVTQGLAGAVIFELQATYVSTVETFPLTFNAIPCASATNTVTFRPQAGATGLSISSANTAPGTIDLSAVTYVIFDGRPGGVGTAKELTIANTAATGVAVRFINDASNNTLTYVKLRGVTTSATSGVVLFSTTTGTTGNDSNLIDNVEVSMGATTPTNLIYSAGTATKDNNDNTVSNSSLYDFFIASTDTNGIFLAANNQTWTITGNSFYETASRTFTTASSNWTAVQISNNSVNGVQITNNYIGGTAASAGGTPLTLLGNGVFRAIRLTVGTTTATSVQGNVIQNVSVTSSSASTAQTAIGLITGSANIGTTSGNTIGSQSVTGSLAFSISGAAAIVSGIQIGTGTPGVVVASNNTIGGISVTGAGTVSLRGIMTQNAPTSAYTLSGNTIGSPSVANSLSNTTNSTVYGIFNSATAGTTSITNNTIANLTTTGTLANNQLVGISTSNTPGATITGNTVSTLRSSSSGALTGVSASVIGILHTGSTTGGQTISQNTVSALANTTGATAASMAGIYYSGPSTGVNTVARNFVHSLALSTASTGAYIYGIHITAGTTTYANNMVRLGLDASGAALTIGYDMRGFYESSGTNAFYFNTVYIGGAGVATGSLPTTSSAFYSLVTNNTRAVQNNIFVNARSNGASTERHVAVILYNVTLPTVSGLTQNNNVYLASGTGGALFYNNVSGIYYPTLSAWQLVVTSLDSLSMVPASLTDINLINPTGTSATVDLHVQSPTVAEGTGTAIGTVSDDYDGQTRSGLTPVDVGADALNATSIDALAPTISYTTLGNDTGLVNRAFINVTATDASGIDLTPGTRPRVYYKRSTDGNTFNDNTSGTDGWKYAEANGVGDTPFDFTIDYSLLNGGSGVSVGTVVQYFVVAQDLALAPNVGINRGGFATRPSSIALTSAAFPLSGTPNSYTVVAVISGTYNIGAAPNAACATIDYTTITAAFSALNSGLVSGPVTYLLCDPLYSGSETFPLVIAANAGMSAVNTVTLQPAPTVVSTISGSSASAVLKLNGATYVTVDGSNNGSGSQDLTLINTSVAANTAVIWLASTGAGGGAANNTLKNLNVAAGVAQNGAATVTYGVVATGSALATALTSGGADNDNNAYRNLALTKARYGLVTVGASSANPNAGTIIANNQVGPTAFGVDEIGRTGIMVVNETNVLISSNEVRFVGGVYAQTPSGADRAGIVVARESSGSIWPDPATTYATNMTIVRNLIHDIVEEQTYSAVGIVLAGTDGANDTSNTVLHNQIYNILANGQFGDLATGIGIAAGKGDRVVYNSVFLTGDTDPDPLAGDPTSNNFVFAVTAASDLTLKNNIGYMDLTSSSASFMPYAVVNVDPAVVWGAGGMDHNDWYYNPLNLQASIGCLGNISFCSSFELALVDWQADVTPQDANSVSGDPAFAAGDDLHITAGSLARSVGEPLVGLGADFDGQTRNLLTPDAGLDEYFADALCDMSGTYADDTFFATDPCYAVADVIANGDLETVGALIVNSGVTVTLGTQDLIVDGALSNSGRIEQTKLVTGTGTVGFVDTGGYGGVLINANGIGLGQTTVVIESALNKTPSQCDTLNELIHRCFQIIPTNDTGLDATVTLFFTSAELNGNTCATLDAYHYSGTWTMLTLDTAYATGGRQCDVEPYSLRVKNVASFSPIGLMSSAPTALTLGGVHVGEAPAGALGLTFGLLALVGAGLWVARRAARG